jgi:hypothetical protein
MNLVKIGNTWINLDAIVGAHSWCSKVAEGDDSEGISVLLSGGQKVDLTGNAMAEATKLLESLTKPVFAH